MQTLSQQNAKGLPNSLKNGCPCGHCGSLKLLNYTTGFLANELFG